MEISSPTNINARSGIKSSAHAQSTPVPTPANSHSADSQADREATKAYIEQVRTLVLGMEQRMQSREENLVKALEVAQAESAKFEEARRQVTAL